MLCYVMLCFCYNNLMSNKTLLVAIKVICFLIPFSLLIIAGGFLFPYITGKALYFRVLIEIAVFLTALLITQRKELLPTFKLNTSEGKRNLLFWSSLLVVISLFILLPFSTRPYISFWGNAERMEGAWGVSHLFLWFFVLYFLFKAEPESKKLIFWAFAIVALLINIQAINDGFTLQGNRPIATLGNATYIGFFNLLMLFSSFYFLGVYRKDLLSKGIICGLMLLSLAAILFSQTRGSIMGLVGGILAIIIYFISTSSKKPIIKVLFLCALIGVMALSYFFLKNNYSLIKQVPGIGRVSQAIQQGKIQYMPRLISWGIFWDAFKLKPIAGYGLENSPDAYYRNFNPDMFKYEEVIFDRPHNKFLETLVTQGIVGFILWMIFIICAFYSLKFIRDDTIITKASHGSKDEKNSLDRYYKGALLGFFVAYLVQNITLFDMQASFLVFFFGLAILSSHSNKQSLYPQKFKSSAAHLIIGISAVAVAFGMYFNFYHYYTIKNTISSLRFAPPKVIDKFFALSGKNSPFIQEEAIVFNGFVSQNLQNINTIEELEKIETVFRRAYERDHFDLRVANVYTSFLTTVIKAKMANNLDYSAEKDVVNKIFKDMLIQYPTYPDSYLNYAVFLSTIGEKEKALETLIDGKEIFIKSPRLTYIMVNILELNGSNKEAMEFLQLAKDKEGWASKSIDEHLLYLRILLKNKQTAEAKSEITNIFQSDSSAETINRVTQLIKELGYKDF